MLKRLHIFENHAQIPEVMHHENYALIDTIGFFANSKHSINLDDHHIDKESFGKRYIELIADLKGDVKPIFWWASALSEKNSLVSQLYVRLYTLVCLDSVLRSLPHNDIILICPDPVLLRQVTHNYRGSYKIIKTAPFGAPCIIRKLARKYRGVLLQLKSAINEYHKLLYARFKLSNTKKRIEKLSHFTVLKTLMNYRYHRSNEYSDPYFKALHQFLLSNNKKVLFVSDIFMDSRETIDGIARDTQKSIIPINLYLRVIDILKCLYMSWFRRPKIKKRISLENIDVTFLIRDELSRDIDTTHFFDALMYYFYCLRLATALSIEKFIYPFENYSWEKMSILGLRKQNPKIKIIGFQHAFIAQHSFKYFPALAEKNSLPLPDKIVTMGKRTQYILRRNGNYPDDIFLTGCALRQDYLTERSCFTRNCTGDILVPLTITVEDSVKVLRFLFNANLGNRHEKIILRFHPATSVTEVLRQLNFKLPANFIISSNSSLLEEIERCKIALYTWTTVCLEALRLGRPAIYLEVNYPLDVDPLFECRYLKDTCRIPEQLTQKIERFEKMSDETYNAELMKAQEYLQEYFIPVTEQNCKPFIE